jgi:hypothetical protein
VARDAVYKEESGQLVWPLRRGVDPAAAVIALVRELVPADAPASVASAAP